MTLALYPLLSTELSALAESYRSVRSSQPLPSLIDIDIDEIPLLPGGLDRIRADVEGTWQKSTDSLGAQVGSDEEVIRVEVELAGRELVLDTAYGEPASTASSEEKIAFLVSMYEALDITLTLLEVSSESTVLKGTGDVKPDSGLIFIPILEELVDLLSVETWAGLFGYLESRSHRFTSDMLPSKGKALPLLKLLNTLLRSISKSVSPTSVTFPSSSSLHPHDSPSTQNRSTLTNLELRARIHIFASQTFNLSDPSGVNLRGEYWVEDWRKLREREKSGSLKGKNQEVDEVKAEEGTNDNADQKMEGVEAAGDEPAVEAKADDPDEEGKPLQSLYAALSCLQPFFANPPSLVPLTPHAASTLKAVTETGFEVRPNELPLSVFKRVVEVVLPALVEWGKKANAEAESQIQTEVSDGQGEYPHLLQSPELLHSQLSSTSYRRQILLQLLIFLQIVRNLDAKEKSKLPKDMQFPATFSVGQEDVDWAREKTIEVKDCLAADERGGKEFSALASLILNRETHYATWKHLGCQPFEKPPASESDLLLADRHRKIFLAPLKPYKFAAGTAALTEMTADPLTSVDQLRNFEIPATVDSLKAQYDREVQDEEDAKAMGQVEENRLGPWVEDKASLSWRALRLVIHNDIEIMGKVGATGDVATLSKALSARAAERSDAAEGGVAMSRNPSGESASGQSPAAAPNEPARADSSADDPGAKAKESGGSEFVHDGADVKMEVEEPPAPTTAEPKDIVME